jgi:serine/threonine protein kinase
MVYTIFGSLTSVAPEVILGQLYNSSCDIWSSGIKKDGLLQPALM